MLAKAFDAFHATLASWKERFPYPTCGDAAWENLAPERKHALEKWAEEALETAYPMLTATQFMAFVRDGSRKVYEDPYFLRRRTLIGAALGYCLGPRPALLDCVVDGLWCICEETFWGISAHNGSSHAGQTPAEQRPLPEKKNPYIDLFAAQTACTLALVVRMMEKELDNVTPVIRRRVLRELDERIFTPFLYRDDFHWMGMIRKDLNNWTPWILSSIFMAALAVIRDDTLLRQLFSRGLTMLDRYLDGIPEDGGCDEGTGYWNMAGGALLDCLEAVERVTGGCVTFWDQEKIRRIGAFPLYSHIAGPWYWNFADCDAKPMMDGERIYAYGRHTGNPALCALGAAMGTPIIPRDTPQMNRVLDALFRAPAPCPYPEAEKQVSLPRLQVFARQWGTLYVACKGGHNGENHNHNDVGTFLLFHRGEPVIVDAGNMVYTAKTFSQERYTLWNTRSRNHNLPLIGGVEQAPGREYAARDVREEETQVAMDIAGAYPTEAGVRTLYRKFTFGPAFVLQDEITLTEPRKVTWAFLSRPRPQLVKGGLLLGTVQMHYDESLSCAMEKIPVTDARMIQNFPGSLWRITLTSPPAVNVKQAFRFVPDT